MTRFLTLTFLLIGCSNSDQTFSALSPAIAVTPPEVLAFEDTIKDTETEGSLFVSNAGSAPLNVSLTLEDPEGVFRLGEETLTVDPDATYTLPILFQPNNYLDFEATLTLTSNDIENPVVVTLLQGTGVDAPAARLCLGPSVIDFGKQLVASTSIEFLEIENCGTADLEMGMVDQGGSGQFTLESDPSNHRIAPGDSFPIIVGYTPVNDLGDNGTLTFPSNDPDQPEATVTLLGNGGGDLPFPEAVVACPEYANPPGFVSLDGTASQDPQGLDPLTYAWRLVEVPSFSVEAAFTDPSDSETDLFLDAAGDYTVELVVTNAASIASAPDRCLIQARPEDAIHVELTWDGPSADLDLHLVENDGDLFEIPDDCTWCNRAPSWGESGDDDNPRLDLDDRGGYGPENINVFLPADGRYHVNVHYFEDHGDFAVTASARIWLAGEIEWEGSKVLTRNEMWEVGTINWPEETFGVHFDDPYDSSRRSCF